MNTMKILLRLLLLIIFGFTNAQTNNAVDNYKLNQDFGKFVQDLSDKYIYLQEKETDFSCVKENYAQLISKIKNNQEKILLFELMLNEFYDSNLVLNVKTKSSFRLYSPFYVKLKDNRFYIENIWYSQIENFGKNIIGAEVLNFNSKEFNAVIDKFPVQCVNKNIPEVREWIANKIISGRYNKTRILTLKLTDNRKISLNIDNIKIKTDKKPLSISHEKGIGVIRFNNSLENANIIKHFDRALNSLLDTKGLILDLRNSVDGGNAYVASAIISRFVNKEMPYQKHISKEKFGNNPEISKSWLTYVSPRSEQYKKPVVVLVGRWTGGVAESLSAGLGAAANAKIIGSEMRKIKGLAKKYSFLNTNYSYTITTDKLLLANGVKREDFSPRFNIKQQNMLEDDVLLKAFQLLTNSKEDSFVSEVKRSRTMISKLDK